MILLLLAMQAAEPVDCAPKGSLERQETWYPGKVCRDDYDREQQERAAIKAKQEEFTKAGSLFDDRPFPAKLQQQVRSILNRELPDEPSTRYEWPLWTHPQIYCFTANTKNQFGGYTGWRTVAVALSPAGDVISLASPLDCP